MSMILTDVKTSQRSSSRYANLHPNSDFGRQIKPSFVSSWESCGFSCLENFLVAFSIISTSPGTRWFVVSCSTWQDNWANTRLYINHSWFPQTDSHPTALDQNWVSVLCFQCNPIRKFLVFRSLHSITKLPMAVKHPRHYYNDLQWAKIACEYTFISWTAALTNCG